MIVNPYQSSHIYRPLTVTNKTYCKVTYPFLASKTAKLSHAKILFNY